MNTYEIQVYGKAGWQFDSYFEDRSEAVAEARHMLASSRFSGVRVVQEDYDQDTNTSNNSIVFSRLDKRNSGAKSSPAKAVLRNKPVEREHFHQVSGKAPRAATKGGGMARVVMSLVLAIAAGVAVMVGIQFYN